MAYVVVALVAAPGAALVRRGRRCSPWPLRAAAGHRRGSSAGPPRTGRLPAPGGRPPPDRRAAARLATVAGHAGTRPADHRPRPPGAHRPRRSARGGRRAWSPGSSATAGWPGRPAAGDVPEPHTDVQYRLGSISKTVTAVAGDAAARRGPAAPRRPARPAPARHAARRPHRRPAALPPRRRLGGEPRRLVGARPRRLAGRPRPRRRTTSSSARPGGSTTPTSGFGLLGELVARLRGTSWEDAVAAEVLAPLGMDRTTPRPVAARGARDGPCTRGPTSSCPSRSTTPA